MACYNYIFKVHMRVLHQQLVLNGVAHDCLSEFFAENSLFMDPFTKVKSTHFQLKFYREHLGLIVSLKILKINNYTYYPINIGAHLNKTRRKTNMERDGVY